MRKRRCYPELRRFITFMCNFVNRRVKDYGFCPLLLTRILNRGKMRKVIPFVVLISLLLWRAQASQTGDEVMTVAPATVVRLTKPFGGDRVMRVDRVCERAEMIVAPGTGRRAS